MTSLTAGRKRYLLRKLARVSVTQEMRVSAGSLGIGQRKTARASVTNLLSVTPPWSGTKSCADVLTKEDPITSHKATSSETHQIMARNEEEEVEQYTTKHNNDYLKDYASVK